MVFLELGKYDEDKLVGSIKNWFQFWGNISIDEGAAQEIIEADDMLDDEKWKPEVHQMLRTEQIRYEEYKATLIDAKAEARAEARAEGIEQGIEQGMAQGVAQAYRQIALKMIEQRYSDRAIEELTGLTTADVQKIKDQGDILKDWVYLGSLSTIF